MFSFTGQAGRAQLGRALVALQVSSIPPALLPAQLPQILPVLSCWGHSASHLNILGSLTIPCCEVTMCGPSSLSISPIPAPGVPSGSVWMLPVHFCQDKPSVF